MNGCAMMLGDLIVGTNPLGLESIVKGACESRLAGSELTVSAVT